MTGKLIGTGSVRRADGEDVAQELRMHVIKKAASYDSRRAKLTTYMEHVVVNKGRDIMEANRAACRDWRKVRSLDEPTDNEDAPGETFGDTIDQMEAQRRCGLLPWAADAELVMDVQEVLQEFSEIDRETCESLAFTKSLREAAERMDIHLETIRQRIVKLRSLFEARGIMGVGPVISASGPVYRNKEK